MNQSIRKSFYFIFVNLTMMLVCEASYAQDFAAKVVKRKRFAQDVVTPDPNAKAKPAEATNPTSGPMEEDLVSPSGGSKSAPKPLPSAPPAVPKPIEEPYSPPPASELPAIPKSDPPPTLPPPEFRERPDDKGRAGDIEEDGDIGVSLGIGFGAKKFSGSLGFVFPIYQWLAWTLSGSYETWADGDDKQTRYGPEASLQARLQTRLPLTPYVGIGGGYDKWTRRQLDNQFDDSGSLLSLYYVGISIPMAKRLAIDISETWKTYLENPPRRFDDHTKREPFGSTRFDIGLSVHF